MLSPANYCREDWHCLICGAPKEKLYRSPASSDDFTRCAVCSFLYSLKMPPEGRKKRYVPKPYYNKRWRDVWYRAFLHFKDPTEVWRFMRQFTYVSEANNEMNHYDGGGMIARERASRKQ